MNFEQKVSMQGKYKLHFRDRDTQELLASSGWSDNKIIKTALNAKTIYETGLTASPTFQLGYTTTGNYDSFEKVVALTHTTHVEMPTTLGWVDAADISKGYKVVGGGNYKFLPDVTEKGILANQVGIAGFSIAQVKNDKGVAFTYPVTKNVEIEIEFVLTTILRPVNQTTVTTYDLDNQSLAQQACRINIAVNSAESQTNYKWYQLLSQNQSGAIAFETVSGNIDDPAVLKQIGSSPNKWTDEIKSTADIPAGSHLRRGYFYSPSKDLKYIRIGVSAGIPGMYTSIMFLQQYVFKQRTLTDFIVTSSFTETGE